MLEKIQAILDKYGVEEVWSTADRFKRTHTDDFFFVGKDRKIMSKAAGEVLSIVAPEIDSENAEENELVTALCWGVEKDSELLKRPGLNKLVAGGRIIG